MLRPGEMFHCTSWTGVSNHPMVVFPLNADNGTIMAEAPEGYFSGIQHLAADGRSFSHWRNVRMDQRDQAEEGMFVERDELIQINQNLRSADCSARMPDP